MSIPFRSSLAWMQAVRARQVVILLALIAMAALLLSGCPSRSEPADDRAAPEPNAGTTHSEQATYPTASSSAAGPDARLLSRTREMNQAAEEFGAAVSEALTQVLPEGPTSGQ